MILDATCAAKRASATLSDKNMMITTKKNSIAMSMLAVSI
jgi:hypothetical protein